MARLLHRFRYSSPTNQTDCDLCRLGGEWKVSMGDPKLIGPNKCHCRHKKAKHNTRGCATVGCKCKEYTDDHWHPEDDFGYCFDNTKIAKHRIVLHPQLWGHPTKMNEIFFHELFHAIDHAESKKNLKGWHLPHSIIFRVSRALSKFMAENNLELVQRKVIQSELSPVLNPSEFAEDITVPLTPSKAKSSKAKRKARK